MCDLCLLLHKICCKYPENSVRFECVLGIAFQMGKLKYCEILHVCNLGYVTSPLQKGSP